MSSICELHRQPMLSLLGRFACPACLATLSERARNEQAEMNQSLAGYASHRALESASVPVRFQAATFGSYVPSTETAALVNEALHTYSKNFQRTRNNRSGFIFLGPPGTGKTHLACAMISQIVSEGFTSMYLSVPRFTKDVKAAYGKPGHVSAMVSKLTKVDFLVLDEIDLHGTTDSDYNLLYDIVNTRYERTGAPTAAISNRDIEKLTIDLDERLISRILGASKPIYFDWKSERDNKLLTEVRA